MSEAAANRAKRAKRVKPAKRAKRLKGEPSKSVIVAEPSVLNPPFWKDDSALDFWPLAAFLARCSACSEMVLLAKMACAANSSHFFFVLQMINAPFARFLRTTEMGRDLRVCVERHFTERRFCGGNGNLWPYEEIYETIGQKRLTYQMFLDNAMPIVAIMKIDRWAWIIARVEIPGDNSDVDKFDASDLYYKYSSDGEHVTKYALTKLPFFRRGDDFFEARIQRQREACLHFYKTKDLRAAMSIYFGEPFDAVNKYKFS